MLSLQTLVFAMDDEELPLEGFSEAFGGLLLGMWLVHDIYMELKWGKEDVYIEASN